MYLSKFQTLEDSESYIAQRSSCKTAIRGKEVNLLEVGFRKLAARAITSNEIYSPSLLV